MYWFRAQFSNFEWNPIAYEKEIYEWLGAKMPKLQSNRLSAFYPRRTQQKLSFHLRNYVQSSRTWQVFQQLMKFHLIFYWSNQSKKKTLNQPWKATTLNIIIAAQQTMAPMYLHEHKTNAGKFRRMKKIKADCHFLHQPQDANSVPQLWKNWYVAFVMR